MLFFFFRVCKIQKALASSVEKQLARTTFVTFSNAKVALLRMKSWPVYKILAHCYLLILNEFFF